jgi:hypothetical protein
LGQADGRRDTVAAGFDQAVGLAGALADPRDQRLERRNLRVDPLLQLIGGRGGMAIQPLGFRGEGRAKAFLCCAGCRCDPLASRADRLIGLVGPLADMARELVEGGDFSVDALLQQRRRGDRPLAQAQALIGEGGAEALAGRRGGGGQPLALAAQQLVDLVGAAADTGRDLAQCSIRSFRRSEAALACSPSLPPWRSTSPLNSATRWPKRETRSSSAWLTRSACALLSCCRVSAR